MGLLKQVEPVFRSRQEAEAYIAQKKEALQFWTTIKSVDMAELKTELKRSMENARQALSYIKASEPENNDYFIFQRRDNHMIEKAITKLKSEIEQLKNDPYIKIVGEFLIQYIEANPEAAEKIVNADRTIAKSIDEMVKVASKKRVGNRAVLTDQEGFDIVLKYFGIDKAASMAETPAIEKKVDFSLKLEELF